MAIFRYHRPSDRLTGTWSIATGTARTGYGVANVQETTPDPSNPFWANETTIRIVCDLGSAMQVDHVYIFAHTLTNSAVPKVQLHTANSWATPDASVTLTVPAAYADGFAYHLDADFASAYSAGGRTKRYLSIVNTVANGVSVAIGEVWIVGSSRAFTRNVNWGLSQARRRLVSQQTSKRGVSTVYDMGTIERSLTADLLARAQDFIDARDLEADAHGNAKAFPIVLTPSGSDARQAEPMLVRFGAPVAEAAQPFSNAIPLHLVFEELGQGELVGA